MSDNVSHLIRENIKKLIPYSSARSEFEGNDQSVFLDANENPYGNNNRYPDPYQVELKKLLAKEKGVRPGQIFLNNGSDGIVDISFRVFCEPRKDKVLIFPPTFGMYTVAANLNEVSLVKLPLNDDFLIQQDKLEKVISDKDLKMVFLCSPNNPTGNLMRKEDIDYILDNFPGIVILDEAYIDFTERASFMHRLDDYPRLVILQTMSKSWGLAGARVGIALMSEELLQYFNKVKTPYNVPTPSQLAAKAALADTDTFKKNLDIILTEKAKVIRGLETVNVVEKIYPSDTNFLLVKVNDAQKVYDELVKRNVIVRNQNKIISNCLRITIGAPAENDKLLKAFEEI